MISFFACILCGVATGLGAFVIFLAVRDEKVRSKIKVANRQADLSRSMQVIVALAVGVVIFLVTRWLLVAVVLSLVFITVPALKSKQRLHRDERGLADAIATWTEQLRDTLAGAHGLEQAIVATSDHAQVAISFSIRRLSAQIQYGKLGDGLRRFADEVDHPIADFVSAALITATKYQARDIAQLLGHLAQCAREEGRMRTRIWVGRARTRSSVRIISFVVIGFVALLVIFNRDYLSVYSSLEGQVMLSCIFIVFGVALIMLDQFSRIVTPQRFIRRRETANA